MVLTRLSQVKFTDIEKAREMISAINELLDEQLYLKKNRDRWDKELFYEKLKDLIEYLERDYSINGEMTLYHDNRIGFDFHFH